MRIRILRFITALVSTGAIFFAVEVCGLSHRYFFLGLAVCLESLTLLASRVGVVSPWVFHLEGLALPVLLALAVRKLAGKPGRWVVAAASLGAVFLTQVAVLPCSAGDEHIVIEKSRFLLTVYRGGSEILQIEVGLGPNSGAKQMIDDGRTPEGTGRPGPTLSAHRCGLPRGDSALSRREGRASTEPVGMITRRWLLALLGAGLLAARGEAKPMETPTLEEALRSDNVVEAEYRDCHPQGKVDYFGGVLASFRVTQSLKGIYKPGQEILVDYAFHDGSACLPPPDFHFSKAMMPPVGKKFVLFLRGKKGSCGTYRGDFGRMASTPRLLETVRHKLHP